MMLKDQKSILFLTAKAVPNKKQVIFRPLDLIRNFSHVPPKRQEKKVEKKNEEVNKEMVTKEVNNQEEDPYSYYFKFYIVIINLLPYLLVYYFMD